MSIEDEFNKLTSKIRDEYALKAMNLVASMSEERFEAECARLRSNGELDTLEVLKQIRDWVKRRKKRGEK